MLAIPDRFLGKGFYTPSEAALYARLSPLTMQRWIHGTPAGDAAIRAELPVTEEKSVTFLDFVQALAVHDIRTQHNMSLQKIRDAVRRAEDKYEVTYPLARQHTTYLYGKDILLDLPDAGGLVQLTGRHIDQHAMKRILEVYLRDVSFGGDGLADRYSAFRWANLEVRIDPKRRFGEPIVVSCDYSAQALWDACRTEGSFDAVVQAYGVKIEEAELAYRYFDFLHGRAAACPGNSSCCSTRISAGHSSTLWGGFSAFMKANPT